MVPGDLEPGTTEYRPQCALWNPMCLCRWMRTFNDGRKDSGLSARPHLMSFSQVLEGGEIGNTGEKPLTDCPEARGDPKSLVSPDSELRSSFSPEQSISFSPVVWVDLKLRAWAKLQAGTGLVNKFLTGVPFLLRSHWTFALQEGSL